MTIVWLLHVQVVLTLRHLHACFVASTSHPSFGIQASNFDCIKPPCRLRHINIASKLWNSSHPNFSFVASTSHPSIYILYPSCGIQALIFDLCCNRCARSARARAFVLNTCIGNNGLSLGARARSHLERAPALLLVPL